jgi:heat-inducible transcriptional repressor
MSSSSNSSEPLVELDGRKQRILRAIVQDYVATAEPVGSHVLVQRYSLGVKSATIRNEMAEMSEQGYLRQPHTSAGRVPSDRGYRFYVNRLMQLPVIQEDDAERMRSVVASASSELDTILRKTCQLLASMTRLPAVATPPDAGDTELRQIFLSPVGVDKVVLVLVFSTGRTENRLITGIRLSASDALVLANGLNERLVGARLSEMSALSPSADGTGGDTAASTNRLLDSLAPELAAFGPVLPRLIAEIAAAARALNEETPVFIEGTNAVLEHPEFRDVERLSQFLTTLQERAALLEMLGRALDEGVPLSSSAPSADIRPVAQVVIGQELQRPDFSQYSVVSSPYYVAGRRSGSIGVLGPTRMDYGRASAAVEFMALTVSDLLTRLSV